MEEIVQIADDHEESEFQIIDTYQSPRWCSLSDGCGECSQSCPRQIALRCSICQLIRYCSAEHLATHWKKHKSACEAIFHAREELEMDEQALRDSFAPVDPFTMLGDPLWDEQVAQNYLLTRMDLIRAMRRLRTPESVQAQLEHVQGLLELSRNDGVMARNVEPQLLLRLNRDQECYGFIKRWRTIGRQYDYNWATIAHGSLDTPNLHNQDAFESAEYLCNYDGLTGFDGTILEHTVAATLLKIKLIIDLGALQKATVLEGTTLGRSLPREILDAIRLYLPRSPIVYSNRRIWERRDHSAIIRQLHRQIDMLYTAVGNISNRFWPVMLDHYAAYDERFRVLDRSGGTECRGGLRNSYDSWVETPGALAFLKAKFAGDPTSRPLTWPEFI